MRRLSVLAQGAAEWLLLAFLVVSILWKGGKTLESTWALGGIAICVAASSWLRISAWRRVPPLLLGSLALFLLWGIASYLGSDAGNYGQDELIRDAAVSLLLVWVIVRPEEHMLRIALRERFLIAMTVATIVACVFGVAVYVLQPVSRFVGTFLDYRFHTDYWPNAWAEYLLLAWPLVLWAVRRRGAVASGCVIGFVVGCLFLSYSRGALLAFVAQGTLLVLFVLSRQVRLSGVGRALLRSFRSLAARHAPFALSAAAAVLLVILSVNALRGRLHEVQSVREKVTFTAMEGTSSVSERGQFWRQAAVLALERPLLGWGPYSFRFIQPRLQTGVFETSDHAHNVFLKLAMERGIPAALLYASILLAILAPSLRRILRAGSVGGGGLLSFQACAWAAVAGVLAHNLIDYNFQFVGILLPFTLLLGFLGRGEGSDDGTAGSAFLRRSLAAASVVLALALGIVLLREGWYLAVTAVGRRAEARGLAAQALRSYDRARGERFSRDLHLSRTQLLLELHRPHEALRAIDFSLSRNAEDARAWILRGGILRRLDRRQEALEAFERAARLGRYNYIAAPRGLLATLTELGDSQALGQEKPEVDQLVAAYEDAILRNAHFIALSGNVEEFVSFLRFLETLYPRDAARYGAIAERAWSHALAERDRLSARRRGYLW